MADSELKDPVVPEETVKTTMAITLVNPDGSLREQHRAPTGRFIKKVDKSQITGEQSKVTIRRYLKQNKRYETMLENVFEIAAGESELDPKAQMASIKAFNELHLQAFGKPGMSEEDKAALQEHAINTVIINAPDVPEGKDHTKIEKPTQPSWMDAEVISTNGNDSCPDEKNKK